MLSEQFKQLRANHLYRRKLRWLVLFLAYGSDPIAKKNQQCPEMRSIDEYDMYCLAKKLNQYE